MLSPRSTRNLAVSLLRNHGGVSRPLSQHAAFQEHVSLVQDPKFVPEFTPLSDEQKSQLNEFVSRSKRLFVLSGAGLSTESGIPDYRSEKFGLYTNTKYRPMDFADFMRSHKNRQRYWARNYAGWPIFSSYKPNLSHHLLAKLESSVVHHHTTQNVDSLLIKAGAKKVTELHGSGARVACLDCGYKLSRDAMQYLITTHNPGWLEKEGADVTVDSDANVDIEKVSQFVLPKCPSCKGDKLKPEIVFFGDNVPREVVNTVNKNLAESDAMLVVGTTLHTYSALRIVTQAKKLQIPIALINIGKTRGDDHIPLKFAVACSEALKAIRIS